MDRSTDRRYLATFLLPTVKTVRGGLASAKGVRRSALLNGAAAGLGVAFATLVADLASPPHAIAMTLGSICVSVADTPAPLSEKMRRAGLAWLLSIVAMLAAAAAMNNWLAESAVVACAGFGAAMVTAYGRTAIPISVAALLSLVFARSLANPSEEAAVVAAWFAAGGACYGLFAAATAPLLARQTKRMLLREAFDGASTFLRAQRDALDAEAESREIFARLIDAQAALAERLQAARDVAFVNVAEAADRLFAALLVITIDLFEAAISEQADLDTLLEMRAASAPSLSILRALLLIAASDLDRFSRSLLDERWRNSLSIGDREALLGKAAESAAALDARQSQALRATANKIDRLFTHIDRMWACRSDPALISSILGDIDLRHFVQRSVFDLGAMRRHLTLQSPVGRFAVRLTLALLSGSLIGGALPYRAHGSWILLTIALVMRANYSVTRQRRDERLVGNILGCGVAALALTFSPGWLLPFVVFLAVGVSHAFVSQSYLVASIASCVMALMQIHIAEPDGDAFFVLMRITDTGIGAAIAYAFSFLLPSWESKTIASLISDLVEAEAAYAQLALSFDPPEMDYRLARRRVFDTIASLSAAARRMLEEPSPARAPPQAISGFLAACYAFAAELASIQIYLASRTVEQSPEFHAAIDAGRRQVEKDLGDLRVLNALDSPQDADAGFDAAGPLSWRLRRTLHVSGRLVALARQALSLEASSKATAG